MRSRTEISLARWPAIRQHGTDDGGEGGDGLDALLGLTPSEPGAAPDRTPGPPDGLESGHATGDGPTWPGGPAHQREHGGHDGSWSNAGFVGDQDGEGYVSGTVPADEAWSADAGVEWPENEPEDGIEFGETAADIHNEAGWSGHGDGTVFRSVPVSAISPNAFQPRARFVEEDLESLASSIRELGVLQPILLRYIDVDRYELIAGERRWRAAVRAGLATIPAIVRPADDRASLEQAVVENLHRADLNPLEEAAAYRQLMDEFGMTQDSVAQRVGKSRSAVANLLRLFQLPSAVQRLIAAEKLGAGHARALLAFPDPLVQEELAERVVREGLSVRRVEELVRAASLRSAERREGGAEAAAGQVKRPGVLAIEELLSDHLDTRVEVASSGDRGRITVEFADADDLDRLAELLLGRSAYDD